MASFPAEPITLSVGQQSPGAPPAQPPRRAPSPAEPWPPLRGHRDVPLLPFAHISFPRSNPLT